MEHSMVLKLEPKVNSIFEDSPGDAAVLTRYGDRIVSETSAAPSSPSFEDTFPGTALNTVKWAESHTGSGSATVSGGVCNLQSSANDGDAAKIYTVITKSLNNFDTLIFKARVKTTYSANDKCDFYIGMSTAALSRMAATRHLTTTAADKSNHITANSGGSSSSTIDWTDSVYHDIEIVLTETESRCYVDNELVDTNNLYIPTTDDLTILFYIAANGAAANQQMWISNVEWYYY